MYYILKYENMENLERMCTVAKGAEVFELATVMFVHVI